MATKMVVVSFGGLARSAARRGVGARVARGAGLRASASREAYRDVLKGTSEVLPVESGEPVSLASLWSDEGKRRHVFLFLSHFGDLTSWEYAQKLRDKWDQIEALADGVTVVGLGTAESGKKFAELLNFPSTFLYADPDGSLYQELGFEQGFMPDADMSPYFKLLPMLAGIGSPGTIQEVLRGYVGDRNAKPIFESGTLATLFNVVGEGYQRPFELATLRLQNMVGILPKVCPPPFAASFSLLASPLYSSSHCDVFSSSSSGCCCKNRSEVGRAGGERRADLSAGGDAGLRRHGADPRAEGPRHSQVRGYRRTPHRTREELLRIL